MQELFITMDIMLPLLLMLLLGVVLRKIGWMPEGIVPGMNQLVFRAFLPMLVFNSIRSLDVSASPGLEMTLFITLSIIGVFTVAQLLMPRFFPDPRKSSVMVQGVFRSNFAVLGFGLMSAMYGASGEAAVSLALPIATLLNNVLAVVAFSRGEKINPLKMLRQVLTNPLIIAAALGVVFLLTGWQLPHVVDEVCLDVGGLASPVSLLVLGASLKWQGVKDNKRELAVTLVIKQLILPAVMVTLAALLGMRQEALGVIVILFGAPGAVSSYPMAVAMGADGTLAASQLVMTTICSMGTLFALIYVGKVLCLL